MKWTKKMIINLFMALQYDACVALSRFSNSYSNNRRLGKIHLSFNKVGFVIKRMKELGLITDHGGFHDPNNPDNSRVYIIKATQVLKYRLANISPSLGYKEFAHEPITMRDCDKKNIAYTDIIATHEWRQQMRHINKMYEGSVIDLSMTSDQLHELNVSIKLAKLHEKQYANNTYGRTSFNNRIFLHRKYLVRVFNRGKWSNGGRMYGGWWQNVPKKCRHSITIDGEDTIELDFDNFHPQILYLKKTGHPFVGDVYTLKRYAGNLAMRKIIKMAMLILINAQSEDAAEYSINETIDKIRKDYPEEMAKVNRLEDELAIKFIKEAHPVIADSFGSDAGISLMNTDSKIAVRVVLALSKEGIVALPVHDSFIVQARHEDRLREVMTQAFQFIMKDHIPAGAAITPGISRKEKEDSLTMELDDYDYGNTGFCL